ncbi:MAG: ABC transporter substrate-binding protein [Spirochaeta sp.]
MKNTILSVLLLCCFALPAFTGGNQEQETTTAAETTTELTMYYPVAVGGPLTAVIDDMIAEFQQENPDITVNAVYAGNYDDTRIRTISAINSGQPAQLSVLFSIDAFDLIEQDLIIPFEDVVQTSDEQQWLNSFYPALMENSQINGKTWGIPFQRSTIIMYYNKDAFRDAGLDPESPPATWDEMTAAAEALTEPDGSRWGIMIPSTGYPYWMFGALAMQNGEVLMNSDGTETYFTKPAVIEALQYWNDLGTRYQVMPTGTIEWGTLRQQFLEQRTAMMWHSTGNLTAVKDAAEFDFGVAMLPGNVQRGTPTGGGNFYLFKGSSEAEQQAALKLIRFMTSPEQAATWSIATGYVGITQESYDTPQLREYVRDFPAAGVARDQLEFATAEFSTYQTGRVRRLLDDAIQSTLTGEQEPEEALQQAQTEADRLLRSYR